MQPGTAAVLAGAGGEGGEGGFFVAEDEDGPGVGGDFGPGAL